MKNVVQKRRPRANCRLQYNKLIVDHEVYIFNDLTGQVEQVYDPMAGKAMGTPIATAGVARNFTPGTTTPELPAASRVQGNYFRLLNLVWVQQNLIVIISICNCLLLMTVRFQCQRRAIDSSIQSTWPLVDGGCEGSTSVKPSK